MGGDDYARIDRDAPISTDALQLALFKNAQ